MFFRQTRSKQDLTSNSSTFQVKIFKQRCSDWKEKRVEAVWLLKRNSSRMLHVYTSQHCTVSAYGGKALQRYYRLRTEELCADAELNIPSLQKSNIC